MSLAVALGARSELDMNNPGSVLALADCARTAMRTVEETWMGWRHTPSLWLMIAALTVGVAGARPGAAARPSVALKPEARVVITNPSGQRLSVSLRCPRFIFSDGPTVGGVASTAVKGDLSSGRQVEAAFSPQSLDGTATLEVKLFAQWSPQESILRKWAMFRVANRTEPIVLKEVVLEDLATNGRAVEVPPYQIQSQPAFLDGFFAGVEFPIAATRLEAGHLLIAHRPGLRMQPGRWYRTRTAIFAVAARGDEKRAFQHYICAHRPGPRGLHVNYNSWWTSPVPYTERDILSLISIFDQQLFARRHAGFDTFCIDMGWSNSHSIWEIDSKLFPDGFTKLQQALRPMNGRLGLWISPSSCYPFALDNEWAKGQGYETFTVPWGDQPARFACLAGRRYRSRFQARLVDMVKRYGIRHVKLDGYLLECPAADHGHEPGPLSSEAVADGIIAVADAVRKAAPDVWLEPTCFGWNPSPWWLFHFNSVIGCYGDDAPWGRVPAPVYRESYTTARDYFNLQGARWNPAPIAAEEVLGIVHQTPEPFLNDAVMTVMRGHMFLPIYLNPAYMSEARWRDLSALLAWAREKEPVLADTEPLLPAAWSKGNCPRFTADAVMPREPYGYAHWRGDEGLIAIRNPWIAPATYRLRLNSPSASLSTKTRLSVVSIYPEVRVYASGARTGDTVRVPLAPYETVVLAVARNESSRGLPRAADALRRRITATVGERRLARVAFEGPAVAYGPDWTSLVGDAAGGVRLQLQARVMVTAPRADLLVLLEDKSPPTGFCRAFVDGKEAQVSTSGSETGWAACGQPKPEHWLFFRAPIDAGQRNLRLEVLTPDASPKVSVWIWATKGRASGAPRPHSLPSPEVISLDAKPLLVPTDTGSLAATTITIPRPIERINGTYLDTIEPESVSQGWGTLQRNRSVWEKPMTIAGRRFLRGLGTHAPSRIVYQLDGRYRRFQSWVGADSATSPTITFEVWTDGVKRWASGLMRRENPAKWVDIDISRVTRLELVVTDAGNGIASDHADWADARLVR
jgi:hypothetical protein